MREIKYKAFIPWLNLILEVDSIDFNKRRVYCKNEEDKPNPCDFYSLDDIVLMQYTEKIDKNNVEIYEGNIIEYNFGGHRYKGFVRYSKENAMFEIKDGAFRNNLGFALDIEVIGNIHENIEILKGHN